jgi:poly(beta-D-mannuronate) lyase
VGDVNFPTRSRRIVALALVPVFFAAVARPVFAATHVVDSIATLKSRIKEAVAGDTIILKNGIYPTTGALTVSGRGSPGQPITIAADTVGEVEISGSNGFNIVEPAAYIVVSGFKFTHAAGKSSIGAGTSHVRFTRNTFQCVGDGPYLNVIGDDTTSRARAAPRRK